MKKLIIALAALVVVNANAANFITQSQYDANLQGARDYALVVSNVYQSAQKNYQTLLALGATTKQDVQAIDAAATTYQRDIAKAQALIQSAINSPVMPDPVAPKAPPVTPPPQAHAPQVVKAPVAAPNTPPAQQLTAVVPLPQAQAQSVSAAQALQSTTTVATPTAAVATPAIQPFQVDTSTQQRAISNTKRINAQDKKIDSNDHKAMRGIASAMAMTGLHYVDTDNAIAVGTGTYDGQSASSMGYRHKFADNVAATVQASYDGEHTGAAASFSVGW